MNIDQTTPVPFSRAALDSLSVVAMADPKISPYEFLSACDNAGVLHLIAAEHWLTTISEDELHDEFSDHMDEAYGPVVVLGFYEFSQSLVLREMDEVAYREALREYAYADYVEHRYCYYKRDEIEELGQVAVFQTLTKHCVSMFGLNRSQAKKLRSASTPAAYVAALRSLYLASSAHAPSRPRSIRRTLI